MSNSIYFLSLSRVFFFFCLPLYNYLLYRFTKSQIQNLYINFKYSSFSPSLLLFLLGILIASCARGLVGVNSYQDCTRSCRRESVRNRPSVREERERERKRRQTADGVAEAAPPGEEGGPVGAGPGCPLRRRAAPPPRPRLPLPPRFVAPRRADPPHQAFLHLGTVVEGSHFDPFLLVVPLL